MAATSSSSAVGQIASCISTLVTQRELWQQQSHAQRNYYQAEHALRCLVNFAVAESLQVVIREQNGIPAIVRIFELQFDVGRNSNSNSNSNKSGSGNTAKQEVLFMLAAWALSNLALNDANKQAILKAGAVKYLLELLGTCDNVDVLTKVLWLLTNLASNEDNRIFLNACGVMPLLSGLLKSSSMDLLIEVTKPIRNMAIQVESQKPFAQSGGVLNLIALITTHANSIRTYSNIGKYNSDSHRNISNSSASGSGGEDDECQRSEELLVELLQVMLTLALGTDVMRKLIVAAGALPPLVSLLSILPSIESIASSSSSNSNSNSSNDSSHSMTVAAVLRSKVIVMVLKLLVTLSLTEQNEARMLQAGLLLPVVDLFVYYSSPTPSSPPTTTPSPSSSSSRFSSLLSEGESNSRASVSSLSSSAAAVISFHVQQHAALLLSNLSCNQQVRENLRYSGLVQPLLKLLQTTNIPQLQEQGARLVTNLAMDEFNRLELVDGGAIGAMQHFRSTLTSTKPSATSEAAVAAHQQLVDAVTLAINNLMVPVSEQVQGAVEDQFASSLSFSTAALSLAPPSSASSSASSSPASSHISSTQQQSNNVNAILSPSSNNGGRSVATAPTANTTAVSPAAAAAGTKNVSFVVPSSQGAPQRPKGGHRVRENMLGMRRLGSFLNPQLVRREKIAKELLQTEQSYVAALNTAVRVYLQPILQGVVNDESIIPADDVRKIFSIIEIIAKINGEFLQQLEQRMEEWNSATTQLGDLLLSLTDKLKVYNRYISNYDNTMQSYAKCLKTSPKFADLIERARNDPEIKGRDLLAFLIMPVQRIPRYILLLEDLLKHTPTEHGDYSAISTAAEQTKQLANFLNESKRKAENVAKLVTLQEKLMLPPAVATAANITEDQQERFFVQEGRSYVREGTLLISSAKGSSNSGGGGDSHYCHFFLLSDTLLYSVYKKKHKKYKVKHLVPLSRLLVVDIPDTELLKSSFKLTWSFGNGKGSSVGGNSVSLVVCANSAKDKQSWLSDLKSCIAAASSAGSK